MKNWYVIQTYSGFETKVRDALQQRFRQHGLESALGEILIPSEVVREPASRSYRAGVRHVRAQTPGVGAAKARRLAGGWTRSGPPAEVDHGDHWHRSGNFEFGRSGASRRPPQQWETGHASPRIPRKTST
ncbi:transcription termination/antitermination NusG family protein [Sorangium sp. So ce281]